MCDSALEHPPDGVDDCTDCADFLALVVLLRRHRKKMAEQLIRSIDKINFHRSLRLRDGFQERGSYQQRTTSGRMSRWLPKKPSGNCTESTPSERRLL